MTTLNVQRGGTCFVSFESQKIRRKSSIKSKHRGFEKSYEGCKVKNLTSQIVYFLSCRGSQVDLHL